MALFKIHVQTWTLGAFMRTKFLCIDVLRVESGPRVKLASCKNALNSQVVCSTDRSKAVVPVLVLLLVALWFILRGDLLYVFPCVILFLCFSVLLVLRLPRLGKRELILVLFVRLFDLCLFRFVGFLFLLRSGKGCGLWLWTFLLLFFMKGMQVKECIIGVRGRKKYPSLGITVWHNSASLVIPDSDPRDGFFYLPLIPTIDSYILIVCSSSLRILFSLGLTTHCCLTTDK